MWIAISVVIVTSLGWLAYALITAPQGYQDETGFHTVAQSAAREPRAPRVKPMVATRRAEPEQTGDLAHST